jgi:outer membrane receptor protein involved in Fe transport
MTFAMAPVARAQQVAGAEVDGFVSDPSGQTIVSAQVKMIEVDKGQIHNTVTDAVGHFSLPNLPVGVYRLEVTSPGFKTYVQTGIELQVAHNIEIPVVLHIGAVTESVQVTANAAMVETKENAIAQVVEERRIVELPLNGRNLTQLLTLTGGGTTAPAGDLTGSKNIQGSNGSGTFAVAGSQANGVSYLLDGGDNNDAFSNVNLPIPFPDAVQEFSVQTSTLPAQYGLHPGGVVNIVTKSGSNGFHGDLFDFLRNYKLNARQDATPARDSLKRNQFGGVAGGRIIKDKLFFFGGFQGTRQRSNPTSIQAHVPTAAALLGDFTVLDGANGSGGCLATARTLKNPFNNGAPFPNNNMIPSSLFDKAAVKLLTTYIPVSTDPCGLTFFGQFANNPDTQYIGRVDYVRSEKHNIFGRYYIYDYTAQAFFDGKNALTTGPTPGNRDRSQTVTIGDTYSFTPTKLNSFHATFDRRADNRGSAPNLFGPNDLGVNIFQNIPNYLQLTVSNYFNVACGTCAPGYFNVNNYQLSDDFTLIKDRHQFAFGFDYRKEQFNSTNNQQSNSQITFNGNTTGDALADLLVGRMSQFVQGNALSDYMRQTVFAFYAQDTYRVTPRLTLNLGVRWEPALPADDKQNRGNQFSLPDYIAGRKTVDPRYPNAPAGLLFAVDPQNTHGAQFTKNHWLATSPRVGLVWDPKGDGKQTIRTGFALIHDSMELFYPERWTTNPPYASSITLTNPTAPFSNPWLGYPNGNPFPGAAIFPVGGTYVSIPPDVHDTYMMQWNLSYQRQLGNDWLATINYLGNRTNHILGAREINPAVFLPGATTGNTAARRVLTLLNPAQGAQYSSIVQTDDGNNASYNGLLLSLNHRFARHFTMLVNYTWSHCVSTYDFGGELAGNNYQDPNNRAAEKGSCNFDRRHIFNTSMVAQSGGLGSGFAKKVTEGWQLAPIISAFSGQPLTPTDGGLDVSLTAVGADRPNVVTSGTIYQHTQASWFTQSAFKQQAPGTYGNAGRDSIIAPGTFNFDVAVSREFSMRERYRLQVRGDFFNILNHPNWNSPGLSITGATFGQITTFGSPRIIQMAMKFFF